MNLSIDNSITAKVVKAIAEFDLINDGDKLAVGLSGGKDSSFLLIILKLLNKYAKLNFELKAVHVDLGFETSAKEEIKDLCFQLDVQLEIIETEIAKFIQKEENTNPCSKCSLFKKGALIEFLKKEKFNKLAFGHHLDDAVETFLMSIFYSAQIKTLKAKRYLSENKIEIIRPLIHLREKTIINELNKKEVKMIPSSCPYDGNTVRSEIRKDFEKYFEDEQLFSNLKSAMRKNEAVELWPAEIDYNLLKNKMQSFWK